MDTEDNNSFQTQYDHLVQTYTQLPAGPILCIKAGGRRGFPQPEEARKAIVHNTKNKTSLGHQKNHKTQKSKKNNKTYKNKNKTHPVHSLCLLTANAAGLKMKVQSLKSELKYLQCGIFTLQETHFKKKGKLVIDDWEIFESIRNKASGGTMIGVHKALQPVLVEEYNDDFELLIVETNIKGREVRIISGYGPQESWSLEDRLPFFQALEEEVAKSLFAGKSIIISLDANSKLGSEIIPNDKHNQSQNGKIFAGIINRHALIVINGLQGKSFGVITRKRTTIDGDEESTIDIIVISSDLLEEVKSVTTDEDKVHSLTSHVKTKHGVKVT